MAWLQAIVFDFDGVIANTEPRHLQAFQEVLGAQGIHLHAEEYYGRYLGFDDAGVFRAIGSDRNWTLDDRRVGELVAAKARAYAGLLTDASVLFPGAGAAVRAWAAHVPLAIASGALRSEIDLILAAAGLSGYFAAIVAAGETPGKPAPDPYRRALALLNERAAPPIAPDRTIAIEDSRWGIESARAAGLRVVAVTTSYGAAELPGADLVVSGVEALSLDAMEALGRRSGKASPGG